jgi:Flp pilus assembly protein TadG
VSILRRTNQQRKRRQRGNVVIEFAFALPVLAFLTLGIGATGLHLDRFLQVRHVTVQAASLARGGAELDVADVQTLLRRGTDSLALTTTGNAVVYITTIRLSTGGANSGRPVITHRYAIGKTSLGNSRLGMPTGIDGEGHVSNYDNNVTAVATLPAGVNLNAGQQMSFAEVIHSTQGMGFRAG